MEHVELCTVGPVLQTFGSTNYVKDTVLFNWCCHEIGKVYIPSPTDGTINWLIKQAINILFSPVTACVRVETVSYKLQDVSQPITRGAGCCQLNYLDRVLSYRTHYSWLLPEAKINYWTDFAEVNPVHWK